MMRFFSCLTVGLIGTPLWAQVDFRRDILPIFSDQCFHCHGPDEGSRKGRLRLDTKEGAYREKNGVAAVVPGKSSESEMIRRIMSADADEVMPPPNSKRSLTAEQKKKLAQWIDAGAAWGRHWSFEPIQTQGFKHTSIDGFIDAELQKVKLAKSPPATKATWLRRVTFDLTGLPPTPAEWDAFEKDTSPQAYERVVDRLLASPRYGERMAADWLDVARFADTHGYQMDRDRPVWPYRDWVIRAFNRNQRYDEFVRDQIAGDLITNASQEQKLATAFGRLHMQNEEGGIVEEEFRVAYVNDRVTTFGTAFLGLTFECSRCHDHKYDPITQKDYYSLFAFFQNIDESGQTSYFTPATPVPALMLMTDQQREKRNELMSQILNAQTDYNRVIANAKVDFERWTRPTTVSIPGLIAHYPFDEINKNQTSNLANEKQPGKGHDGPKLTDGQTGRAVALNGENGFTFPGVGHFTKSDPFSISLRIKTGELTPRAVVLHHSRAPIDAGSRGYELLLENGQIAFGLHHMWPGNSVKVRTKTSVKTNIWTHITLTSDGSGRAAGLSIYVNGLRQDLETIRDDLTRDISYEGGEPDLTLGYRFRDNGFRNGAVDDLRVYSRELSVLEAKTLSDVRADDQDWLGYYRLTAHEPTKDAREKIRKARRALDDFEKSIPEIMTMKEMPAPKPAFVLKRGQYDALGDKVSATAPEWLNAYPAGAPKNRMGLMAWLLAEENPLFARVGVNRLWQQMFGRGLVETSDNFGTQGAAPTHPELLDWLAVEFRKSNWDVKAMLKRMALSDVYRRSSTATAEAIAQDPTNQWLGRSPVRKLSAEMLRDQALAVSGLLVEKLGGPSVKPYQPDGLWDLAMGRPKYNQAKGDDLYRRSVYTYVKRTAPHPQQQIFDAADRSNCSVRRQTTSTPLQALALLNDPQMIEAARATAAKSTGTDDFKDIWKQILTNEISEKELNVLNQLYDRQLKIMTADPSKADRFLKVGDKRFATTNPADLAARTAVVLMIFNHDAAVNCR